MANNIKLRIYNQKSPDGLSFPEDQNTYLEKEYKTCLFDFAYLLAISLNEEFLPPYQKKSYFGYWEELKKHKNILERTKATLPAKPFFKRLFMLIDEYLNDIEIGLKVTRRPTGSAVWKRTKVVLLWTHLLRKEGKNRIKDRGYSIERQVDWKDFYSLLKWFYLKLKDCSYSSFIKPKHGEPKERDYLKSLLKKHYDPEDNTKHWYDAKNRIGLFRALQRYLRKSPEDLPRQTERLEKFKIKPYPIIKVNFTYNSIEVGELTEKNIMIKKYSSIEKKRVPLCKTYNIKAPEEKVPSVIFPEGEVFLAENYVPPHYPRVDSHQMKG